MRRMICVCLGAAMAIALAACGNLEESGAPLTAQAGATYTGTVSELSLEHIVVTTASGDVWIPYSGDTVFSGFAGGMQQPGGAGGMPPDDMGQRGASPEEPGDGIEPDRAGNSSGQETPPELPDAAAPEAGGEGVSGGTETEDQPEQSGSGTIQDIGGAQQSTGAEAVSLNDEVTVVVGDDGAAASVTLASGMGTGGVWGDEPIAPDSEGAASAAPEETSAPDV